MTLSEFRAWLDGFSEGVGDAPTPEQWQRIQQKLAEVIEIAPAPPPAQWPTREPVPGLPWKIGWPLSPGPSVSPGWPIPGTSTLTVPPFDGSYWNSDLPVSRLPMVGGSCRMS